VKGEKIRKKDTSCYDTLEVISGKNTTTFKSVEKEEITVSYIIQLIIVL